MLGTHDRVEKITNVLKNKHTQVHILDDYRDQKVSLMEGDYGRPGLFHVECLGLNEDI